MRQFLLSTAAIATCAFVATACTGTDAMAPAAGDQQAAMAPPGGAYQKVSELVALPEFIPGLGALYVQPATLPAGPFLAYDRDGRLVSTIYMIPLADIEADTGSVLFSTVANYDGTGVSGDADNPHFIFDPTSGTLYYDADVAAPGYTVMAQVQPGANVTAADIQVTDSSGGTQA